MLAEDGSNADALTKSADEAMYRAKERGRNAAAFFTPEMDHLLVERLREQLSTEKLKDRLDRMLAGGHGSPSKMSSTEALEVAAGASSHAP